MGCSWPPSVARDDIHTLHTAAEHMHAHAPTAPSSVPLGTVSPCSALLSALASRSRHAGSCAPIQRMPCRCVQPLSSLSTQLHRLCLIAPAIKESDAPPRACACSCAAAVLWALATNAPALTDSLPAATLNALPLPCASSNDTPCPRRRAAVQPKSAAWAHSNTRVWQQHAPSGRQKGCQRCGKMGQ